MPDRRAGNPTGVQPIGQVKPFPPRPPKIPQPRATSALSEDRQWLVVLDAKNVWNVMEKRYGQATHGFWWKSVQDIPDTGQDANAVLATWLEGVR